MGKQRRWIHRWLIALVLAALGSSRTAVLCADDSLLSEARRERGTIRWYTALNVNGSKPLADAFEKKYPFVRVDVTRLSNERILNRIFAEAKSAAPQFDVTSFAYLPLLAEKICLRLIKVCKPKLTWRDFLMPRIIGQRCIPILLCSATTRAR